MRSWSAYYGQHHANVIVNSIVYMLYCSYVSINIRLQVQVDNLLLIYMKINRKYFMYTYEYIFHSVVRIKGFSKIDRLLLLKNVRDVF